MTLVVMLFLYVALLSLHGFLISRCLSRWGRIKGWACGIRRLWFGAYVLFSSFPVLGTILPDLPLRYLFQKVGNLWLGFILYHGGLLLLLYLLGLMLRLFCRKMSLEGKGHGAILCLSTLGALFIFGYGLFHAQQTKVVSYELWVRKPLSSGDVVSLRDASQEQEAWEREGLEEEAWEREGMKAEALEEEDQDMTLVLIGDLHLGVNSYLSTTKRLVELVNAQHPDVVLVAGDIFTSCYKGLDHPEDYAKALCQIEAKQGVYGIYGNHDVEEALFGGFAITPVSKAFRSSEMEAFMKACSFQMLEDTLVTLPGGIQLAGRLDGEKAGDGTKNRLSAKELLSGADQSLPIFVLEHEPVDYQNLKEAGADVVLSGHTHAGQMFPGNLVVPFFNENPWGHRIVQGMDTFVTAGVGYYGPPMRVGTDSEVTVIHVHF